MDIHQQKKELRRKIKAIKKEYSYSQKREMSISLCTNIENLKAFQNSSTVMAYWSMEDEVSTHDFVKKWSKKKRIILPVVNGDKLLLKEFHSFSEMKDGEQFAIPEPIGEIFTETEKIEFIIVPGVAFDVNGNRMGRGKAYYDKLLVSLKAYKLGLCFPFQILENIPIDEYDVQMDAVIC